MTGPDEIRRLIEQVEALPRMSAIHIGVMGPTQHDTVLLSDVLTLLSALPSASPQAEREERRAKDIIVKGELDKAKRRALTIFNEWQRVTGCLDGSSYLWELEGCIKDAVEIGVQTAMGVYRPLDSETDYETAAHPPAKEG